MQRSYTALSLENKTKATTFKSSSQTSLQSKWPSLRSSGLGLCALRLSQADTTFYTNKGMQGGQQVYSARETGKVRKFRSADLDSHKSDG